MNLVKSNNNNIPQHLICPITHDILVDPVIAKDGYTYSRKEIEKWINVKGTSPITRIPLNLNDLIPNRALSDEIEKLSEEMRNKINQVVKLNKKTDNYQSVEKQILKLNYFENEIKSNKIDYILEIINNNKKKERKGLDVVIVKDVSGSMGCNLNDNSTDDGNIARIDLTKHALKSVIRVLVVEIE